MARREKARSARGFVFFDVLYEDGARSSLRVDVDPIVVLAAAAR